MRAWPLTPTRDSDHGSLGGEAKTASSNSPTGSVPSVPGAPCPMVDGAGSPPQPDHTITPKRLDLQRKLQDVKSVQDVNRALHGVAGQRMDKFTESVNKMRAELHALLVREAEMKDQVAEKLQQLEQSLLMVSDGAQSSLQGGHIPGDMSPDWADWAVAEGTLFQALESRVRALEEEGTGHGPSSQGMQEELRKLMERVADLEAKGPRGAAGRGVGLPSKTPARKAVESKVVLNLAELTDDKNKFRQWDIKLANALAHVEKSYWWAMECIKECIDGGGEYEDDVRIMLALENSMGADELDADQLASDLQFILVDKAKIGSDILHRVQNAKSAAS